MALNTAQAIKIIELVNDFKNINSMCMVGKQSMTVNMQTIKRYLLSRGLYFDKEKLDCIMKQDIVDSYDFFVALGVKEVHAIDISNAEGADIILDLNNPIEQVELFAKFDLVLNGGTLEHIFDTTTAMNNISYITKKDGMMIHLVPCAGYVDHGFVSFSPTYFVDYYEKNASFIQSIFLDYILNNNTIYEKDSIYSQDCRLFADWKCIDRPSDMNSQVDLIKKNPAFGSVLLWCIARKGKNQEFIKPQQGLYERMWEKTNSINKTSSVIDYKKVGELIKCNKDKRIGLFCQGNVCDGVLDFVYKNDLEESIVCIFDNNIKKAGTSYRSFKVMNPSKNKLSHIDIIIICTELYAEEIIKQLFGMGYYNVYTIAGEKATK